MEPVTVRTSHERLLFLWYPPELASEGQIKVFAVGFFFNRVFV